MEAGAWAHCRFEAPEAYRSTGVRVEIEPTSYWFPAIEMGTSDLRCLGVLLQTAWEGPFPPDTNAPDDAAP